MEGHRPPRRDVVRQFWLLMRAGKLREEAAVASSRARMWSSWMPTRNTR